MHAFLLFRIFADINLSFDVILILSKFDNESIKIDIYLVVRVYISTKRITYPFPNFNSAKSNKIYYMMQSAITLQGLLQGYLCVFVDVPIFVFRIS